MAAWIWNGPGWLRRRQARTSAWPSAMSVRSHSGAVLVGEADHRAVGRGAGRAAGLGEQHQGEQADRLGLVGHELDEHPAEADRLARQVGPGRATSPEVAVWPSVKIR